MSSHRPSHKSSSLVHYEVAAAEVLAWLSDCIQSGLCFVSHGIVIFENAQFGELVEAPQPGLALPLRKRLLDKAMAWNHEPLGAHDATEYRLIDRQGDPLAYECRLNVVPYRSDRGVLMEIGRAHV